VASGAARASSSSRSNSSLGVAAASCTRRALKTRGASTSASSTAPSTPNRRTLSACARGAASARLPLRPLRRQPPAERAAFDLAAGVDVVVTRTFTSARSRSLDPFADRVVVLAARVLELLPLNVNRPSGEEVVAAAVVEVKVRVDDDVDAGGEVEGCSLSGTRRGSTPDPARLADTGDLCEPQEWPRGASADGQRRHRGGIA
jgi:hypothetical protein